MGLDAWLSFCLLELLVCISPGPAVLFITATTATSGIRQAVSGLVGVLLSNILYFLLSAMGVAAILLTSDSLYMVMRVLGGTYLAYLGLHLIFNRPAITGHATSKGPNFVLKGFLMQTSNPKSLVYFIALLPQFINPQSPVLQQILLLGITSIVIESMVMCGYIVLSAQGTRLMGKSAVRRFRSMAGGFMVYAGCRLLLFDR